MIWGVAMSKTLKNSLNQSFFTSFITKTFTNTLSYNILQKCLTFHIFFSSTKKL